MTRPRRFYLDLALDDDDPPGPGDVLRSTRVDYLVTDVRPADSRMWGNRWTVTIRSLGAHRPEHVEGRRTWPTQPYRKGEGPHDHFGEER